MKKTLLLFAGLVFLTLSNQAQTVTDVDGNVYNTVTIGTQEWMNENLKVTHYQNGNPIPYVSQTNLWQSATTDARCYYDTDSVANKPVYGGLYNWLVVNDSRQMCPSGWHVPSDSDWTVMEVELGSDTIAIGGNMKEAGIAHWGSPNTGATNSSNFNALPGGKRKGDGMYFNLTGGAYFWTSTLGSTNNSAKSRNLSYNNNNLYYADMAPTYGFSVRCVKNSLTTQIKNSSIINHIQIYPNPAIDRIYIDYAERQDFNMQVYNIIGECVLHGDLTSVTNMIDISSLTTGIYLIRLTDTNGTYQQKLIKN